jgi:two-component system, cell cycle sensor histidine kinase and response regulator CckA
VYGIASAARRTALQPVVTAYRATGETVLVIEDEADLRNRIVSALRRRRYQVIEARTGEEALELVEKNGENVDLLITDIVMPGMSGTEAVRRLSSAVPDLKVSLYVRLHG